MFLRSLITKNPTYPESNGYYNRIPVRIHSFVLIENTESSVVYHTTSQKYCNKGTTLKVVISKNKNDRWGINIKQSGITSSYLHADDLNDEKLSRLRAFWHGCQYMKDKKLNNKERYSRIYKLSNEDSTIFDADAFFKNGHAVTKDPFGEFLR